MRSLHLGTLLAWFWRSLLVGAAYLVGVMLAGMVMGMLGVQFGNTSRGSEMLPYMFAGCVIAGLAIAPVATHLAASRVRHMLIWGALLYFNLFSVMLEGYFFAPTQIGTSLPVLAIQQLVATLLMAVVITWLFAPRAGDATAPAPMSRPWFSWAWRFIVCAASYFVFYFIFGGLNYALVTQPYYQTHAGGLQVPPPEVVFAVEPIRGVLLVLSLLPLVLTLRTSRRRLVVTAGLLLFAVGGLVPLSFQAASLPALLLIASGWEIFFQNFATGAVVAWLLGRPVPSIQPAAGSIQPLPAAGRASPS